jgi:phosphotriesterase-related protein
VSAAPGRAHHNSVREDVWTTTGRVPLDELGMTLVHEHVKIVVPGADMDPTMSLDRADAVARAVDALSELHDHGVRTVIDPTPIDQGRDAELIAEVSSRSGINLVCATGFYFEDENRGVPFYWRQRHAEEIAELFVAELERGIGATGIRAGVIKAATGRTVGRHDRKIFEAAGIASAATGATVITHTEHSLHGEEQQRMLRQAGADLNRCVIGHLDKLTAGELIKLAEAGSMVSVDRIGWDVLGDEGHRADLVAAMFEAGLSDRLCVSQDRVSTYWSPRPQFWVPHDKKDYVDNVRVPALVRDGTTKGFAYLFTHFAPLLEERGVGREELCRLLVDNPRRLLGGAAGEI